jgi:hypothetical protein
MTRLLVQFLFIPDYIHKLDELYGITNIINYFRFIIHESF